MHRKPFLACRAATKRLRQEQHRYDSYDVGYIEMDFHRTELCNIQYNKAHALRVNYKSLFVSDIFIMSFKW